jgi:glyoxylase-like metal-dependent hydrolase (beta-lactamase superfamily II)
MNQTTAITKPPLLLCLILCMLFVPNRTQAQQSLNTSEKSYQRARRVLEAGIEALGGLEAIAAIHNLTIVETGKHTRVEHPAPEAQYDVIDWAEIVIVDFSGVRLYHEIKDWNWVTVINGNRAFTANVATKIAWQLQSASVQNYPQATEKLPHYLLREALSQRAASLRWLGEAELKGRKQQVIIFSDKSARQVSLYFDAQTHLLIKYEYLYTDSVTGDTLQEHLFPAYRRVGRFQVPTGLIVRKGGRVAQDVRYERLEINALLSERMFTLPEGCEIYPPASYQTPPPLTLTKIASDVYLMQGVAYNNNVLVVAFNDFLMVIESPELGTFKHANEQAIARLKETFPGKPIRYHAFTHFHADHGGGARAYIAEGATILTTPGNKQFVEHMAAAPFLLMPDALARNPQQPLIEIIKGKKHVIRDEHHVVEFYDVGPYPHVKEELIVYLPQEKLLFEGDLFTSGNGDIVAPASSSTILLADKIRQLGLNVEQIVGVHGRLRPIADLYTAIEKRQRMSMK